MSTEEEIEPVFGLEVGDRIQMSITHPHHGKVGIIERFDQLEGLVGARVRFDDGRSAYVTRLGHFRKPRRRRRS